MLFTYKNKITAGFKKWDLSIFNYVCTWKFIELVGSYIQRLHFGMLSNCKFICFYLADETPVMTVAALNEHVYV